MSECPTAGSSLIEGVRFWLVGPDGARAELSAGYDEDADVLYLSVGDEPSEGAAVPTNEGIVVLVGHGTREIVGVTVMDWAACWCSHEKIGITMPGMAATQREAPEREQHRLELVPA